MRPQGTLSKHGNWRCKAPCMERHVSITSDSYLATDSHWDSKPGAFLTTWLVGQSNVFDVVLCALPNLVGAKHSLCHMCSVQARRCRASALPARNASTVHVQATAAWAWPPRTSCTAQYTVCQVEPIHFHASCVPCPCCPCAPCAAYCSMCCVDCLTSDCAHVMAVAVILVLSSCPSSCCPTGVFDKARRHRVRTWQDDLPPT